MDLEWFHVLCEDMNRARSLTVHLLVKYNEWEQLVNLRCHPRDYCDFDRASFAIDYQITEMLRKASDLPLPDDRLEAAAIAAFWEAERQCFKTNRKLSPYTRVLVDKDWYIGSIDNNLLAFLSRVREIVGDVLGRLPHDLNPKFSSGSTFRDAMFITSMDKMSSRPTVTSDAWSVVNNNWSTTLWCKGLCQESPDRSQPEFLPGNRFTTVPKDATKHRGICIEPSLNIVYQLSVGKHIRERLLSRNIDLNFGQLLHQRLVRDGSSTRDIATIDLSSASDTVCSELVRLVLPVSWYDLLDSLRSPYTLIEGKWHKNHKFSSMGNGFTFELESLIFYAICIASGSPPEKTHVYGDDIIVPVDVAGSVLKNLTLAGFTANERKTFCGDVPFRESCGADYFNGLPCRPFYLKEVNINEPLQWIAVANGLSRMAWPNGYDHSDRGVFSRAWSRCINNLPRSLQRIRGPESLGDSVIRDPFWTRCYPCRDGVYTVKVLAYRYKSNAQSSYDRPNWTRSAIIASAVLGRLKGAGDTHYLHTDGSWVIKSGQFQLPRHEPIGYHVTTVVVSTASQSVLSDYIDMVVERRTTIGFKQPNEVWCKVPTR